jgi:hypothetical protein
MQLPLDPWENNRFCPPPNPTKPHKRWGGAAACGPPPQPTSENTKKTKKPRIMFMAIVRARPIHVRFMKNTDTRTWWTDWAVKTHLDFHPPCDYSALATQGDTRDIKDRDRPPCIPVALLAILSARRAIQGQLDTKTFTISHTGQAIPRRLNRRRGC